MERTLSHSRVCFQVRPNERLDGGGQTGTRGALLSFHFLPHQDAPAPFARSESTRGRCSHMERGARPQRGRSQRVGNRHILLTASREERRAWPLLNSGPPGTEMKEI